PGVLNFAHYLSCPLIKKTSQLDIVMLCGIECRLQMPFRFSLLLEVFIYAAWCRADPVAIGLISRSFVFRRRCSGVDDSVFRDLTVGQIGPVDLTTRDLGSDAEAALPVHILAHGQKARPLTAGECPSRGRGGRVQPVNR